jgi:hypothetical protein
MKKQTVINTLNYSIATLTALQGILPGLPPLSSSPERNAYFLKIISAIIVFVVPVLTAWKQKASEYINDNALLLTFGAILLAIGGGLNDLFNGIDFNPITQQWLRFGVTAISLLINLFSRKIVPSAKETIRKENLL